MERGWKIAMVNNDYAPTWTKIFYKDNNHGQDIIDFWKRIAELHKQGKKCKCGNNESTPYNTCTKCFLKIDNAEFMWYEPRSPCNRWLRIKNEFYWKMIKYETEDSNGALEMTRNRGKVWELLRWYFYEFQNKKCNLCNNSFDIEQMELDHIIEKYNGGFEDEDNLQMLCKLCHHKKTISIYYD